MKNDVATKKDLEHVKNEIIIFSSKSWIYCGVHRL